MLKVLMTADTIGGVWTYAVQLAAALQPYGVEVVLCSTGRVPSSAQRDEVARLENVCLLESGYKLEWMDQPWHDVAAARQWLQETAAAHRPDIVHLNDFSHGAAHWNAPVLVAGHSCVLSWHEAVRRSPAGEQWARYRKAVGEGIQGADAVVAPSAAMLHALQRHYGPLKQAHVIYNGLSTDTSSEAPTKKLQVLAAGRLWDDGKNIAALLRAAERITCPVLLAGDTTHPDGDRFDLHGARCLGTLTQDALAHQYAEAAIYALPARYEPFGYTPLEAAMRRCALVLGDIPSLREIWQDAAVYVPPDDCAALADAINRIIANPAVLARQADAANQRAAKFTAEAMARGYLALYRKLLTERQPHHNQRSELCVS